MKLDRHQLLTIALAAGALVRCECGEVEEFIPGGTFTPSPVLDFGPVAVTGEKTLSIDVLADGRAALILSSLCTGTNNDLCVSEAAADEPPRV